MLRPDGLLGRVVVDARARDVRTGADGDVEVRAMTSLDAEIDFTGGWTLRRIASDPAEPRLESLVGDTVGSGFRRRVQAALPDQYEQATRLHLLLDDFPVATLVSGYALGAGGIHPTEEALERRTTADLCSGWRSGGTIMVGIERDRLIPVVTGPEAPSLDADPDAWHSRPPLTAHAVRRARRLDVWSAGGVIEVDSLYRDSHVDPEGGETVIHEYTLRGQVDPVDFTIRAMVATPRVLPWVECPAAAASASRLVGQDVRTVRPLVRAEFIGISTCTHLNDQMRALADLPTIFTL
ncbi:Protein of unknown function [Cryptosporangium aurantiacum]|uniref:DUF2889 domain-containing protein n=2 Tax=Cryptosporangium aurantiacum TaxID=134849 RepID=A0A1M7PJ73_9ACTN|nr:Protein of unknown function [Cryptosporangium aurantiacum]